MVDQAVKHGLLINNDFQYEYKVDLSKDIHDSAYELFGVQIGTNQREACLTEKDIPKIHWSVREKIKLRPDYKPLALRKPITDIETLSPYAIEY